MRLICHTFFALYFPLCVPTATDHILNGTSLSTAVNETFQAAECLSNHTVSCLRQQICVCQHSYPFPLVTWEIC